MPCKSYKITSTAPFKIIQFTPCCGNPISPLAILNPPGITYICSSTVPVLPTGVSYTLMGDCCIPTPTPRPTNPPLTPTPRPTNPPLTPTPRPTNPPLTPTPRPTNPPLTPTPVVTVFTVTNSGYGAYIINGNSNPTLTLTRGQTYTFNISASGHPFWIKTVSSTGTGNQYNTGVTNNGTQSGTITFVVPTSPTPSTLYYNCQYHSSMAGTINVIT